MTFIKSEMFVSSPDVRQLESHMRAFVEFWFEVKSSLGCRDRVLCQSVDTPKYQCGLREVSNQLFHHEGVYLAHNMKCTNLRACKGLSFGQGFRRKALLVVEIEFCVSVCHFLCHSTDTVTFIKNEVFVSSADVRSFESSRRAFVEFWFQAKSSLGCRDRVVSSGCTGICP